MVKRSLTPGRVIKLFASMGNGVKKEKRFVILTIDNGVASLIMNSEKNPYILARPEMNNCQVFVEATPERTFVDHDSYINCFQVWEFPLEDVMSQLISNRTWILGEIDAVTRQSIGDALKWSIAIPLAHVRKYLAALG